MTTTLTSNQTESRLRIRDMEGDTSDEHVNVGAVERVVAAVAGSALLGGALARRSTGSILLGLLGGALLYRSYSGYCPVYQALGIDQAHQGSARPEDYFQEGIQVEHVLTIDRPAEELYRFWRNFENLPHFMRHLESVRCEGPRNSHWVAIGPAGSRVEWDAEIINEEENQLIAWRSKSGADVDNTGSVRFLPASNGRGTEVRVTLQYIPPAGRLGSAIAKLFGREPRQQVREDLRRFKQLMETGEIATVEGQPRGSCT